MLVDVICHLPACEEKYKLGKDRIEQTTDTDKEQNRTERSTTSDRLKPDTIIKHGKQVQLITEGKRESKTDRPALPSAIPSSLLSSRSTLRKSRNISLHKPLSKPPRRYPYSNPKSQTPNPKAHTHRSSPPKISTSKVKVRYKYLTLYPSTNQPSCFHTPQSSTPQPLNPFKNALSHPHPHLPLTLPLTLQ